MIKLELPSDQEMTMYILSEVADGRQHEASRNASNPFARNLAARPQPDTRRRTETASERIQTDEYRVSRPF